MAEQQGPEQAAADFSDRQEEAPAALTVSQALTQAKDALESIVVRVMGEVSEYSNKPGYKAVYFTVKDEHAALPCMIWMSRFKALGIELRVGDLVEMTGRFSLYAAKGRMNFEAFSISLAGEGRLRMQVAELAKQLAAMGLMDAERKRPVPAFPQTIGLVTSPRGDAVHDVLRTLRRRYPLAKILFAGVPVEGAQAANAMVDGLAKVVFAGAEVVLLVRGGGSFEDMMPFNDRRLARTIAACPVPVVTGIGHEPDTMIADLVADVRASTPTAAAEAVAPSLAEIEGILGGVGFSLRSSLERMLQNLGNRLDRVASRPLFREPQRLFENEALALDDLSNRLERVLPQTLERDAHKLELLRLRMERSLSKALTMPQAQIAAVRRSFVYQGEVLTDRYRHEVARYAGRLNDLSPLGILARGYAIARDDQGSIIKSVAHQEPGSSMTVTLSDGELDCTVQQVRSADISL